VASIPGLKEVKRISAMSKYIDADRQGGVGRMLITLLLLAEELFS
jgi:hypothetical protein